MKWFMLVIIFFFYVLAYSQENELNNYGEKHGLWKEEIDITLVEGDNPISALQIGSYNNGVKYGLWETIFKDSLILEKRFFTKDGLDSLNINYFETGQLNSKKSYSRNPYYELLKVYNKNGFLETESFKTDDSLRQIDYWSNGKPRRLIKKKYHKKVVTRSDFYFNGNLKQEITEINGKRNGIIRVYYDNCIAKETGEFKNGNLSGKYKVFYKSGAVKVELEYIDGVKVGEGKYYNLDGSLKW